MLKNKAAIVLQGKSDVKLIKLPSSLFRIDYYSIWAMLNMYNAIHDVLQIHLQFQMVVRATDESSDPPNLWKANVLPTV